MNLVTLLTNTHVEDAEDGLVALEPNDTIRLDVQDSTIDTIILYDDGTVAIIHNNTRDRDNYSTLDKALVDIRLTK